MHNIQIGYQRVRYNFYTTHPIKLYKVFESVSLTINSIVNILLSNVFSHRYLVNNNILHTIIYLLFLFITYSKI